jgi:hypothetical protein
MATVHSLSGPPPSGGSGPRGPVYQVTTRELSFDFVEVGPDQPARDLGSIDAGKFCQLLEQLCAIDPLKLVDADPQIIVTVKNGRFLIQPQGGKLLVRPVNALDQIFFKFAPDEIPGFLDDSAPKPSKPPAPTTLIGSAVARVEAASPPPPQPAAPPPRQPSRVIPIALTLAVALVAAGTGWFFYFSTPPAPPPPPVVKKAPEFDLVPPEQLAGLQQRFAGTYATSGEAGERLLDLRADGTFNYQEFGTGVSRTAHEAGTFTFAWRHGTQTPVLRAGPLGVIEANDENSLVVRKVVFTRLPPPPK